MNIAQSVVEIKTLIDNKDCRSFNMLLDHTVERLCDYLFTEFFSMKEWGMIRPYEFIALLKKKLKMNEIDYEIVHFMEFYCREESSYCCSLDFIYDDYQIMVECGRTDVKTLEDYDTLLAVNHAEVVLELLMDLLKYLEEKHHIRAEQIEMR